MSESVDPWVYSLQFLFKSTNNSWRSERKCEWVFFSEHSVGLLSIVWVQESYAGEEYCVILLLHARIASLSNLKDRELNFIVKAADCCSRHEVRVQAEQNLICRPSVNNVILSKHCNKHQQQQAAQLAYRKYVL